MGKVGGYFCLFVTDGLVALSVVQFALSECLLTFFGLITLRYPFHLHTLYLSDGILACSAQKRL